MAPTQDNAEILSVIIAICTLLLFVAIDSTMHPSELADAPLLVQQGSVSHALSATVLLISTNMSLKACGQPAQSRVLADALDVIMLLHDTDMSLQARGQPEQAAAPTFFDIISGDEDTTLRSIVQITNGVTGIVDKVQTLLVYWEKKYKHMWDQDKDAYIRCETILEPF